MTDTINNVQIYNSNLYNKKNNEKNDNRNTEEIQRIVTSYNNREKNQNKSDKRKLYIILSVFSVILIGLTVILIIFLRKKKKKNDDDNHNGNDEPIKGNNGELLVVKLKREINQVSVYNETIKMKTKAIFNEPLENGEKEKESNEDILVNRYMTNIYDQKIMEDNSILYYGYVLILNLYNVYDEEKDIRTIDYMGYNIFNGSEREELVVLKNDLIGQYIESLKQKIGDSYEELYGKEIRDEINYLTLTPLVKFSFFENGTINQILKPKIIDSYAYSNLENFIFKSIPSISKSLYSNLDSKRQLQENIKREVSQDRMSLKQTENSEISFSSNSNVDSETNVSINDEGYISEVESSLKSESISDINDQIDDIPIDPESPIQKNDLDIEDENLSSGSIKSISNTINSRIFLEFTNINETVKNTMEKIIKDENVEFEETYLFNKLNGNSLRRRLTHNFIQRDENGNNIKEKKFTGNLSDYPDISKLRNLDIKSLENPVMFSYSIFKSNLVGVKVGMSALVSFFPSNGTTMVKIIFNNDNNVSVILEKTEVSNIGNSLKLMDKIIDFVINDIIKLYKSITTNQWVNIITKELLKVSSNIKKCNDISKVYIQPLNELIENLENSSKISFQLIHQKINETNLELIQLKNDISSNPIKEENTNKIIEETENEFNSYIQGKNDKISSVHNSIITFMDELTSSLGSLSQGIDISLYYNILEQLNLCSNIYEILNDDILKKAINSEKESFNLYIKETINSELDEILKENEFIANRLYTNETLKESIDENNRNDMIKKLNSFRENINNIISTIQKFIGNSFDNSLKQISLSNIINYKNEFISKKSDLINELNASAKNASNFLSHVEDLETINLINTNIFKKRNELFSKYMIKRLQSIENEYMNENKLKSIDEEISKISELIKNEIYSNKENDFSNLNNLVDDFCSKIKQIDFDYFSDNLYEKIFKMFNNTNLIKLMIENYYNELTPEFNELEVTFYEKVFSENMKKYVMKPNEIIYLLNQMFAIQNSQKKIILKKITSLIYTYIKMLYSYSYYNYIDLINKHIEYINKNIPNDNIYGNALENINYLRTKFDELIQYENSQLNHYQMIILTSYHTGPDPLDKSNLITPFEDNYTRFIKRIIGYVQTDFELKFCDEEYCEKLPELDQSTIDNYNNAICRYGINVLKNIYLDSENIISTDSIKQISSQNYLNEYKNNSNYNKDQIISDILLYLNTIMNEDILLINPYLENNFNNIQSIFSRNINDEFSKKKLEKINEKVFVLDKSHTNNIKTLKSNLKGKISSIFSEEKKNLNEYYFDIEFIQNDFEIKYKNLESSLTSNSNNILNLIKYDNNSFHKIIIDYYLKDKEQYKQYIENAIIDATSFFSDFKLLNKTFNYTQISTEQLENISNTFAINFEQNSKNILNEAITNFSNNILKKFLDEEVNHILNEFNTTYEIYYTSMSQGSIIEPTNETLNVTSFSNTFNNNLTKHLNYYIQEINKLINTKIFNDSFINKINTNLGILDTEKYNIENLDEVLLENGNYLKTLCEDRYNKQKVLLNEKVYSIVKENYKNNINNFINSYSSIYFDKIYEETYTDNILYQLEYSLLRFTDIQTFIKDSIEKINYIQEFIKNSLLESYENIKNSFTNNLIQKTQDYLYTEIDKFNIESSELITNKYLEEIKNLFNGETISKSLGSQIIENIPKDFSNAFYKEMLDYYITTQKSNIDNFKKKFLDDITSKGEEIVNLVNNGKSEIDLLFISMPLVYKDFEIKEIEILVDDFTQNTNLLLEADSIPITDKKKQYLRSLLIDTIKPKMNQVISIYSNSDNEIKTKISSHISSFKDYSIETIENLKVDNIIQETQNSYSIIEQTKGELITFINDKVNNFSSNIEKNFENDFNDYKNNIRRLSNLFKSKKKKRNLEQKETNIKRIGEAFSGLEKKLKELSNKLLMSDEYINFNSDKTQFSNTVKNAVEHLKDPIKPSLDLLKDYLTDEELNSFENNLNTQSDKIVNELKRLLQNEIIQLGKISNYINNDYQSIYSEVYVIIKVIIDALLLSYFDKIFKDMKTINVSENTKMENGYIANEFSENMNGDIVVFKSSTNEYGFSHTINLLYEDYKIITNIEGGGYANINALYQSGDFRNSIYGTLGNGQIGIKTIGDLTTGKVELTAYIKQNESSYIKKVEEYVTKEEKRLRALKCKKKGGGGGGSPKPAPIPTEKGPSYYSVWEVTSEVTEKTVSKLKNIFKYY